MSRSVPESRGYRRMRTHPAPLLPPRLDPPRASRRPAPAAEPRLAVALQPFVDDHKLAGAVVLVASPERTLDLEAVGYSDVAAKTPMKPDDLFWIASMSKPMTASALMMLVDEGKVRLDDPVEKYLPEFRGQMVVAEKGDGRLVLKKPAHPITVRERPLAHRAASSAARRWRTSSTSSRSGSARSPTASRRSSSSPARSTNTATPASTRPGRIIEVVSGMPYEDFMQKRLFDPARHEGHDLLADRVPGRSGSPSPTSPTPHATASRRSPSPSSPIP